MILEFGPNLFRYNISEPPAKWDKEHARSTEHNYNLSLGLKNKIGAFFLYDTIEAALNTGIKSAEERNKSQIWITTSSINDRIKILDFSNCHSVNDFLNILDEIGLNVRIADFKINGTSRDLSELIDFNENSRLLPSYPLEIELGYFGQLLTDFHNGVIFLNLIEHLKIDGYRWRESPDALTYCLFNSDKLNDPKHVVYML
jgi:hypothetical protein